MGEDEKKFIERYNELCKEMGLRLAPLPQFISRDDGTFSVVVRFQVVKMEGEQQ